MSEIPMSFEESLRRCSTIFWPKELIEASKIPFITLDLPDSVTEHILGTTSTNGLIVSQSQWPSKFQETELDRTDYSDGSDYENPEEETQEENFPEWNELLNANIQKLGGAVFPKLNWSAPKDAFWMTIDGTLKCRNSSEVMLLLRSSDYISSDIDQSKEMNLKPCLILKQWHEITPSSELRCFILNRNTIVSICQRNIHERYSTLEVHKKEIFDKVTLFLRTSILRFLPCPDCVVDLCCEEDSVYLIDISPLNKDFLENSNSLLSWDELQHSSNQNCTEIKVVKIGDLKGVQPCPRNLCGVPTDIRDATNASDLSEIINEMERDTHKQNQQQVSKQPK